MSGDKKEEMYDKVARQLAEERAEKKKGKK